MAVYMFQEVGRVRVDALPRSPVFELGMLTGRVMNFGLRVSPRRGGTPQPKEWFQLTGLLAHPIFM